MRTYYSFVVLAALSSLALVAVHGEKDDSIVFINSIAFGDIDSETCGFPSTPPEGSDSPPEGSDAPPEGTVPPEGTDVPPEGTGGLPEGTDAPGVTTVDVPGGTGTDADGGATDAVVTADGTATVGGTGTEAADTEAVEETSSVPGSFYGEDDGAFGFVNRGAHKSFDAAKPQFAKFDFDFVKKPEFVKKPAFDFVEKPAFFEKPAFGSAKKPEFPKKPKFAKQSEFIEQWWQAAAEAEAPRRRLKTRNTDGPTSIHVEVASGASVESGAYTLHAVTQGGEVMSQPLEITSEYLYHTEFLYNKFEVQSGDSIAQGCVYLNRTDAATQEDETISCVVWGADSAGVCPCDNPTTIAGEVADGNLWALQLPTVEGGAVPFLGAEQGDFIAGVDGVAATADNCKFGEANVGQSFAGDNNSTAMINEVIFHVECHGAHAVNEETSVYNGIEVAAFQPDDTPVELLLVAVDHNNFEGWTTISTSVAGSWNFEYVAMANFTSSQEMFGDNLSSGFVLLLDANFTLLSSISWGKPGGVTINWNSLEGAPSIGSRTYYPLVVSAEEIPPSPSYLVLSGSMAVMKDGIWGQATDAHCTPGEANAGQTSSTTAGLPPGGAHKSTVLGVCLSVLGFSVLSHLL